MTEEQPETAQSEKHALVLFDGVCNLCNGAVTFVIDRDPEGYFRFAALQSEGAQRLLLQFGVSRGYLSSIVVIEEGRVYGHSDAVLAIARRLRGFWPLLYMLKLIPRPIRDLAYSRIAAHRYHWFGMSDSCRIPTPELRARFLEAV